MNIETRERTSTYELLRGSYQYLMALRTSRPDDHELERLTVDVGLWLRSWRRCELQIPLPGTEPEPRERAHARATDPDTSQEAAASLTPEKLRKSQLRVLRCLRHFGRTGAIDEEIIKWLDRRSWGMSRSGTQTRRKELQDAGLVEYTGQKKMKRSGRRSRVHRITAKGLEFLQDYEARR